MRIIPPGSGIIHQVNLEYLARVVFDQDGYYYPDSLVGTDSHTTMIDGLGILGWGEYSSGFLFHTCCSMAYTLIFFVFLGPHSWHTEVPRLGVEWEL